MCRVVFLVESHNITLFIFHIKCKKNQYVIISFRWIDKNNDETII